MWNAEMERETTEGTDLTSGADETAGGFKGIQHANEHRECPYNRP